MCSHRKLRENPLDFVIPDFATSSETANIHMSNKQNTVNIECEGFSLPYCCWSCLNYQDTLIKLFVPSRYLRNTADRSRKTKFVILFLIALCPLLLQTTHAAPMSGDNSQAQQQELDFKKVLEPAYNNSHRIADLFKKTFIDNKTIEQEVKFWGRWLQKDLEKITPHIQAIEETAQKTKPNSKEIYDILNHLTVIVDYLLSAYDIVLRDLKCQGDVKNVSFFNILSNLRNKVKETQSYLHPVIQIMESTYNFRKPTNSSANVIQTVEEMPIMRFLKLHYEINKIILDIFNMKLGLGSASSGKL